MYIAIQMDQNGGKQVITALAANILRVTVTCFLLDIIECRFCDVACSWELVRNSFTITCHVTMKISSHWMGMLLWKNPAYRQVSQWLYLRLLMTCDFFHSSSLQYVDQVVMSQTLARSLAQVCSKKLSTLYSAAEQMQSEQQNQGANTSTRTSSSSVPSPVPSITSERYTSSTEYKWKKKTIVEPALFNLPTSPLPPPSPPSKQKQNKRKTKFSYSTWSIN